jgi:hypothetical protein
MGKLTVSFEIAWEDTQNGRDDYRRIYDALNEAIKNRLDPLDWWAENTSFYVIRSEETPSAFLVRVWNASGMRSGKDRIVVTDPYSGNGAAFGHFEDETLFSLLPDVRRLEAKKR